MIVGFAKELELGLLPLRRYTVNGYVANTDKVTGGFFPTVVGFFLRGHHRQDQPPGAMLRMASSNRLKAAGSEMMPLPHDPPGMERERGVSLWERPPLSLSVPKLRLHSARPRSTASRTFCEVIAPFDPIILAILPKATPLR